MFSDVFKKHSLRDGERLFMSGTSMTTPAPENMLREWQKPWLFIWVLGACLIVLALGYILTLLGLDTPAIAFIGTAAVPVAMLVFTWELNIPRNVPAYKLLFLFLAGGMLSLVATGVLLPLEVGEGFNLTHALSIGIVEEIAKLVAVVAFVMLAKRGNGYTYILTGLLVGSAIGNGFSAFESGLYFVRNGNDFSLMLARAILAPGGHGLWAAMYGGALIMAKGQGGLRLKHFIDKRFLLYFFAAVGLHAAWDWNAIPYLPVDLPVLGEISVSLLAITLIGWLILLTIINKGVQQTVQMSGHGMAPAAPSVRTVSIRCVSGALAGQTFPLIGGALVLGRDPAVCNLLFPTATPGISRRHCTVSMDPRGVLLTDDGSRQGTFLDGGKRLEANATVVLRAGQRFYLASAKAMFEVKY
ncbi:MAG: PrsW family intramembrane metalloprotease [Oscillospiraceae bacterium]|nr:PrsW family intramembrane metalloprotease [Oscillospiraceae bacterium]